MTCHPVYRLREMIIHLVDGVLLLVPGLGGEHPAFYGHLAQPLPIIRVIRDHLCQNIPGSLQSFLGRGHPFLLRNIGGSLLQQGASSLLEQKDVGQGLQPLLLGDGSPGAPLRLVGTVNVLHRHQGGGRRNSLYELLCQLSLLLNAFLYLSFSLLQISQILETLMKLPQLLVIERASGFLPVPGNKGYSIALIYQRNGGFHLPPFYLQFFRKLLNHVHNVPPHFSYQETLPTPASFVNTACSIIRSVLK